MRLTLAGARVIATSGGGGVRLIVAVAVFVGSAWLAAITVTVWAVAMVAGAVYKPLPMAPTGGLSVQETPVLLEPVTVAVNC